MEPVFLELDEVLAIHADQINRYGGSPGIRDMELLKSTTAVPSACFDGNYLHVNLYEMAAAYLFHIVQNHPFIDGNKRTGAVAAVVFLILNGLELNADEENFEKMLLSVAEGKMDKVGVARFLKNNSA
jgi:death on curing protein